MPEGKNSFWPHALETMINSTIWKLLFLERASTMLAKNKKLVDR